MYAFVFTYTEHRPLSVFCLYVYVNRPPEYKKSTTQCGGFFVLGWLRTFEQRFGGIGDTSVSLALLLTNS